MILLASSKTSSCKLEVPRKKMHAVALLLLALLCVCSTAYLRVPSVRTIGTVNGLVSSSSALMGLRRNNKEEKRLRNRFHSRRFRKTGLSTKKLVREMKRGMIADIEEKVVSQLFTLTTDEDMPVYSGFGLLA